jgi:hypothetical protein
MGTTGKVKGDGASSRGRGRRELKGQCGKSTVGASSVTARIGWGVLLKLSGLTCTEQWDDSPWH